MPDGYVRDHDTEVGEGRGVFVSLPVEHVDALTEAARKAGLSPSRYLSFVTGAVLSDLPGRGSDQIHELAATASALLQLAELLSDMNVQQQQDHLDQVRAALTRRRAAMVEGEIKRRALAA